MEFRIAVLAGVVSFGLASQVCAQLATRPDDDLLGLWGAEAVMGPQVHGEALLERIGPRWTLRVGGFEAHAVQEGDSITVPLAGGQGMLKAWMRGRAVSGFWIQPGSAFAPPYASPVRFVVAGANSWRGKVAPLITQFPLYLQISRDSDSSLRGVFRNPAANWPGRAGWYRLRRSGDNIDIIVPRTGKVMWSQAYDSAARTITFDFGGPVVLTPRTAEQAVGFAARSPSLPPYVYRVPMQRGDGWSTWHARAAGVDDAKLQSIVRDLVAVSALNDTQPRLHALLVARRGRLVLDEYFRGYSAYQVHDLRSASKTVTSVMAGVAMQRGAPFDMSTTVGPPTAPVATIGQLLSHTSGLACDDDDDASPGNEDTMQSQQAESNWYRFFLALPRAHPPGSRYSYCSAGINMVGSVIGDATSAWLPRFFDEQLATPLQISTYAMNLMPSGEAYMGGGLHLLPRDALKFGELYLRGGIWHGRRLVSRSWVAQSTARQVDRSDGSTDGFGWHRHLMRVGAREYSTYEAGGNGGQFVVVIPALDLVIATTAGNYGQYGVWRRIREVLVPQVMAAVVARGPDPR
jgi:CubicO group peptidase (beta-lactamase class C family)